MRWTAAAACTALLLLLAPPPGAGQGNPEGVRVFEDVRGDVALQNPSGTPVPVSGSQFDPIDLLAGDFKEDGDGFFATLWIAAFPQGGTGFEGGEVGLLFRHVDVAYAVRFQMFNTQVFGYLESDPSLSGELDYLTDLEVTTDPASGRLTAFIPRQVLGDRDGAPPFPGRQLEGFRGESRGFGFGGTFSINGVEASGVQASDSAASAEGLAFPVQSGVQQSGEAVLYATRPFRASNGEAATFIFEVEAANLGEDEAMYRLAASRVPAGWEVTFPQSQVRIDGEDSRSVPVLATVPFAHQHGRLASFLVELQDLRDAGNVGRVELGLHYTDPPQPAGHHSTLILHSHASAPFEQAVNTAFNFGGDYATMNTMEDDPSDDGVPVRGQFNSFSSGGGFGFQWAIALSPRLQMGIDADLTRTGTISVPIGSSLPMPGAVLDGYLYVYKVELDEEGFFDGYEEILLGHVVPTAPVDIAATGTQTFETLIVPDRAGDYIPYDPEANLVLVLNVSTSRPATFTGPEAPSLLPGGHLTLPLLEYADPVDDLFSGELGLELEPVGGAERRAPPGGATIFTVNATGPAGRYVLQAHGPESSWVEFPAGTLSVGEDGEGRTQVLVRVPSNATNGTVVDVVVEASGGPADAVRSLARLRVTVDESAPDEAALAVVDEDKDAPGLAPLLAAAAVALAALLRRRRA